MPGLLHIRYLDTARTLCDDPERLDNPGGFVVADYAKGFNNCVECSAIIFAHNKKSFDKELLEAQNMGVQHPKSYKHFESEYAAVMAGLLLGFFIWGVILGLLLGFGVISW